MPEPEIIKHTGIWMWIAGVVGVLYTAILSFVLNGFRLQIKEASDKVNDIHEKCIPRPECERTHDGVDASLARIEKLVSNGFKEVRRDIGEVHERINKG